MTQSVPATETRARDYRWDRLRPEDVEAWASLVNHLADVDGTGEFYSVEDLAEEMQEQDLDLVRDTWVVWAGEQMVGFGGVRVNEHPDHDGRVRIHLEGGVHQEHRGRGLGRALMEQMERRGAELADARHPGRPAYLRAGGGVEGASVRPLLEHRGYALVRYFTEMRLTLAGQGTRPGGEHPGPAAPPPPAGVRLVSPDDGWERATLAAHRAAFVDHWGSAPTGERQWHEHWTSRSGRPAVSTLAVTDDGEVVGYVLCAQWVDRQLYVNIVGTVPSWRGRGLARACLARTARLAAETGDYDVVELAVDSASPTGATRLYEAVGYLPTKQLAVYQRDVSR
ncbi:GNAT family N-acetyltransferase [Ornithinicoccus halotolerans]|uniref:GNAT family N-acetyltransferase n=1 Tax=Ornithinicoccus halotolerans TaxID=1748220 RepID=UPI00129694D9|nr:GNAT family N-acetyltransferase [Ornithinicoccus halotolerans]